MLFVVVACCLLLIVCCLFVACLSHSPFLFLRVWSFIFDCDAVCMSVDSEFVISFSHSIQFVIKFVAWVLGASSYLVSDLLDSSFLSLPLPITCRCHFFPFFCVDFLAYLFYAFFDLS